MLQIQTLIIAMWRTWVGPDTAAIGSEEPRQIWRPILKVSPEIVDRRSTNIIAEGEVATCSLT